MIEPILRDADVRAWNSLKMLSIAHSRTSEHAARVAQAKRVVEKALATAAKWSVMWSGGKDSTAMAHLISSEMGKSIDLVSEKDDLDYPNERDYVETLAKEWGARLSIVVPERSPAEWLKEHGLSLGGADDVHGRQAGLSKACFYNTVEETNRGYDGIFLGLRAEESKGRLANRASHGLIYQKKPTETSPAGLFVAQPLADWTGIDVFAYLLSRNIPVLPVYKCIGLLHAKEPWRVRKSWWIPGTNGARGQVTWLRHYWPSLYLRLVEWIPSAKGLG